MKSIDNDRRKFLKNAGGSLFAVAAGSSLALSAMRAQASQSAVTQTKQTQAAITPVHGSPGILSTTISSAAWSLPARQPVRN
jgi:hypothetical protein